jgi:mersacidin/lichenicidin family type 2 lantibiotic
MPRASHGACSSRTSSNRSGTRGVGAWLPDGIDVKVVENADDCVYITLPAAPAGALDLSDDELNNAAGGTSILDGWDMIEAQNL